MLISSVLLSMTLAIFLPYAQAAAPSGLHFGSSDWELACDNTRTCRAAGYQDDSDELTVSVLLTRKAGPHQPVTGQLMIGQYGENEALNKLPPTFKLSMWVNQRAVGQVVIREGFLTADLSAKQVAALLVALPRNSSIGWGVGEHRWNLSDKGAAAVLLKMDEFQGRVGTQGALFRKGSRGEDAVFPPLPAPVVIAVPLAKPLPGDNQFATKHSEALREALRATNDGACPILTEERAKAEAAGADKAELFITRLTNTKILVSTQCWAAAYNFGSGYWVINDTPPYHPILVTTNGSDHSDGNISATHKGRGLGDCWSSDGWTWDGKQFIHTASSSTGMCKLLAPGGAWELPTIITNVRSLPR